MALTPYAAHKIVNELLEAHEIKNDKGEQKVIPPQMMYVYANKGYIESFRGEGNKIYFKDETFAAWLVKYMTKLGVQVTDEPKTDPIQDLSEVDFGDTELEDVEV